MNKWIEKSKHIQGLDEVWLKKGQARLDEINYVMKFNFLDVDDVIQELKKKPPLNHVILTGGSAPKGLVDFADLVTEMQNIKHPYCQGIKAQPGIDF